MEDTRAMSNEPANPPEEAGDVDLVQLAEMAAQAASRATAEIIVTQVREIYSEWSGPLPSPLDLQAFENIQPGFAERIMVLAEQRANHIAERQMGELEVAKQELAAQEKAGENATKVGRRAIDSHTMTMFGFLVAACYVVYLGNEWPGVALGAVPLSRYIFMFIQEARERASLR